MDELVVLVASDIGEPIAVYNAAGEIVNALVEAVALDRADAIAAVVAHNVLNSN